MATEQQKQILADILSEIEKHTEVYRYVECKSAIGKLCDERWHNYCTIFKMLQSGTVQPWKKHFEKNNFVILSALITLDKFKPLIERFLLEQILDIDEYRIEDQCNFYPRYFYGSEQSKRFNVEYAVNVWRINGKQNTALPESSLELESNDIPFTDIMYAIGYYVGVSPRNESNFLHAVHIIAPLYYGRIKSAELCKQELTVETEMCTSNKDVFCIKYNTEGPIESSSYYETIEGETVTSIAEVTKIRLKKSAEIANVWLYHTKGFKVDYRVVRRSLSIEDVEEGFSQGNIYPSDEAYHLIRTTIDSASVNEISKITTTELSVDSIDIESLKAIKTYGGEYLKFFPEVLKFISLKMLLSRLSRLRLLGFLTIQLPKKVLLTSLGVDALNFPPSILSANVPSEVDRRLSEIKLALKEGNYDEVTNKSTKLLEALLRERLESKFRGTIEDVWPNLKLRPYNRASLGVLKEACVSLKIFEKNGISDHLISAILKLRVPMAHEKEEINYPSNIAFLTVRLVEAFLRNWYYLTS